METLKVFRVCPNILRVLERVYRVYYRENGAYPA